MCSRKHLHQFITALFIPGKEQRQSKCSSTGKRYTKYDAFNNKRKQTLINTTTWVNLKNTTLSERSKTQKIKDRICILYFYGISGKIYKDLQTSGCLGVKMGMVINCKLVQESYWGDIDVLELDCGDAFMTG